MAEPDTLTEAEAAAELAALAAGIAHHNRLYHDQDAPVFHPKSPPAERGPVARRFGVAPGAGADLLDRHRGSQ